MVITVAKKGQLGVVIRMVKKGQITVKKGAV